MPTDNAQHAGSLGDGTAGAEGTGSSEQEERFGAYNLAKLREDLAASDLTLEDVRSVPGLMDYILDQYNEEQRLLS